MQQMRIGRHWIQLLLLAGCTAVHAGPIDHLAGIDLTTHLRGGGVPRDGIPAMTNPSFVPAAEATHVGDFDPVLGVYIDGVAKAYPESIGWWHEIVNDRIGDRFITVTLCPLTGTPQVFDATDEDGHQIEFGVSGLLINSNLVMYDRRDGETLYPQMIYTAINGPDEGERLTLLPVVHTTFARWRQLHPDTQVAEFGTGLDQYSSRIQTSYSDPRRFDQYPYGDYRTDDAYLLFTWTTGKPDLSEFGTKDLVLGVCMGDELRAYPFRDMGRQAVINDELGGESLLVIYEQGTTIPYSRDVDGRTLTFYQVEAAGDLPVWFRDVETRSLWNMAGVAVEGPLEGQKLHQVPAYNSMWFAWHTYWPQTSIWDGEGILTEAPPLTAILEPTDAALPTEVALNQNYPNPFNPATLIQFDLPTEADLELSVYNVAGQLVRRLADGPHPAGAYEVVWNGRDEGGRSMASGVYVYRLIIGQQRVMSRQMVLLH